MAGEEPPYLSVGTDVSAKYKGAFCEAKVKKVNRSVKCKVTYKFNLGSAFITDDQIKGGAANLRIGAHVEAKHPEKNQSQYFDATVNKVIDNSQYTVVFDDGDETTLRRTSLCLKSGRHFAESDTLDQLPLTHPEHFLSPVISSRGRKRRSTRHSPLPDSSSEDEQCMRKRTLSKDIQSKSSSPRGREPDAGKVVCVDLEKKKQTSESGPSSSPYHSFSGLLGSNNNWFPGLVVVQPAQELVRVKPKDEYLIRSFKDGRYYAVIKKETREFTREIAAKVDNGTLRAAVEKALQYLDRDELPPHWDRDILFGLKSSSSESSCEDSDESDSSDDEPSERKDRFVAQLYNYMDDRGTPINKAPSISNRDLNLYKLYKIVNKSGGYAKVTNANNWKQMYMKMGLPNVSNTSLVNQLKNAYKKFLLSFHDFYRKLGCTMKPTTRSVRYRAGRTLLRMARTNNESKTKKLVKKLKVAERRSDQDESTGKNLSAEDSKDILLKSEKRGKKDLSVEKSKGSDSEASSSAEDDPPKDATVSEDEQKKTRKSTRKSPSKGKSTSEKKLKGKETESTEICGPDNDKPKARSGIEDGARRKGKKPEVKKEKDANEEKSDAEDDEHDEGDESDAGVATEIATGDRVRVKYGRGKQQKIYEAKVLDVSITKGIKAFKVHYFGWNSRFDEWVKKYRIVENLSTKEAARKAKAKVQKSGTRRVASRASSKVPSKAKAKRSMRSNKSTSLVDGLEPRKRCRKASEIKGSDDENGDGDDEEEELEEEEDDDDDDDDDDDGPPTGSEESGSERPDSSMTNQSGAPSKEKLSTASLKDDDESRSSLRIKKDFESGIDSDGAETPKRGVKKRTAPKKGHEEESDPETSEKEREVPRKRGRPPKKIIDNLEATTKKYASEEEDKGILESGELAQESQVKTESIVEDRKEEPFHEDTAALKPLDLAEDESKVQSDNNSEQLVCVEDEPVIALPADEKLGDMDSSDIELLETALMVQKNSSEEEEASSILPISAMDTFSLKETFPTLINEDESLPPDCQEVSKTQSFVTLSPPAADLELQPPKSPLLTFQTILSGSLLADSSLSPVKDESSVELKPQESAAFEMPCLEKQAIAISEKTTSVSSNDNCITSVLEASSSCVEKPTVRRKTQKRKDSETQQEPVNRKTKRRIPKKTPWRLGKSESDMECQKKDERKLANLSLKDESDPDSLHSWPGLAKQSQSSSEETEIPTVSVKKGRVKRVKRKEKLSREILSEEDSDSSIDRKHADNDAASLLHIKAFGILKSHEFPRLSCGFRRDDEEMASYLMCEEDIPSSPTTSDAALQKVPATGSNNGLRSPFASVPHAMVMEAPPTVDNTPPTTPEGSHPSPGREVPVSSSTVSSMSASPSSSPAPLHAATDAILKAASVSYSSYLSPNAYSTDDSHLTVGGCVTPRADESDGLVENPKNLVDYTDMELSSSIDAAAVEGLLSVGGAVRDSSLMLKRQGGSIFRSRYKKRLLARSLNRRVNRPHLQSHYEGTGSDSEDQSHGSGINYLRPAPQLTFSSLNRSIHDTSRYNFYCDNIGGDIGPSERIALIQERLQELRKVYMSLKAEVASIDRRRKRQRKKEREAAAAHDSSDNGDSS